MKIQEQLIKKIKEDTGYVVKKGLKVYRPTLSWQHKCAGRMVWYWYDRALCIGSAENMKELLKSPCIVMDDSLFGFVEFSSS